MQTAQEIAVALLEKGSRLDLPEFCWEYLHEQLYSKQREIAESVRQNRRTAVKSCHGAGKSYTAARLTCYWLWSHRPGTAFVVTTAPTHDQVKGVLWREINRAHRKGNLQGRLNLTEWWLEGELVALGRKPSDYDIAAFQGIHQRYTLVILDEACGIPKNLWVAANSLASNDDSRILAIGNPDDPGAYFYEVCKPNSGWNVIQISYLDTPAFSGEVVPKTTLDSLIGPIYVEETRRDYGEASPIFVSKCLGEFPLDADDGVVSLAALRHCQREDQPDLQSKDLLPHELGWDVGAGGDRSVVRERKGRTPGKAWYPRGSDTMAQVGEVVKIIRDTGATAIKVDTIGVGWGAGDRLEELRREGAHKAKVIKVKVSEAAREKAKYYRLRDQIWWEIGHELIRDGALDLRGLDDAAVAQLTAPKYQLDSSGRIKVEPKSDTRLRLGRSPDDADALLLAYYSGQTQGQAFLEAWRRQTEQAKENGEPTPAVDRPLSHPRVSPRLRCEHRYRGGWCVFCGSSEVK